MAEDTAGAASDSVAPSPLSEAGGAGLQPQLRDEEIEAVVRRYLAKVARRYVPLAIGLTILLLVVTLVPTVNKSTTGLTSLGRTGSAGGGATPGAASGPPGSASGLTPGTGAGSTGTAALGGATSGNGGGPSGGEVPAGITPPAAPGAAGVTRSGVQCGPGVLQVPWTNYAPPCVPAYSGNNGGATSYGVNASTITLVFRRTNSAEEKAAFAIAGSARPGTDDQYLADMRTYLDLFNRTFELYGRKVVIKDFVGQGDNLEEDQGRDLEGAQADAATAKRLGAFGDVTQSPTLALTQPYAEDLAQQKITVYGGLGLPLSWYKQYSPYEFSYIPDGTKLSIATVNGLCRRAVGLPAIFAGDPLFQKEKRVFGLITPDNPVYAELGDLVENGMKQCGGAVKVRVRYSINVATMSQQAVGVIAQMKTNGVTTVLCGCDPVFEITISDAADGQSYNPEWFVTPWIDPQGRETSQKQWAHAISGEGTFPLKSQSEWYRVWKMAAPTREPQEQYAYLTYETMLYVFNLLQAAGPNLTPATVRDSAFSMRRSATGDFGTWSGGTDAYTPNLDAQIGYWDPNVTSNFDGKKGAWLSCESGKWYPFNDPTAYGAVHTQPSCFGR